jgi:hypothetical protein
MSHYRDALICLLPRKTHNHLRLGLDLGLAVGHLDAQLLRLGDDIDALPGGDGVGDPNRLLAGAHGIATVNRIICSSDSHGRRREGWRTLRRRCCCA